MTIKKSKRELLCLFQNNTCENCKKKFELKELEIHRINPELGYDDHRNLKVLCKECHEIFSSAQRISEGIQGR